MLPIWRSSAVFIERQLDLRGCSYEGIEEDVSVQSVE